MIPRLWLVTDSEAHVASGRQPFAAAFAGLPPDDKAALVRLVLESWRRQRILTGAGKRALEKRATHARACYDQWRAERPDEYEEWRDALKGAATADDDLDESPPRWELVEVASCNQE